VDPLTLSTVCLLCVTWPAEAAPAVARWQPMMAQASARFGVPIAWIARVMTSESAGETEWNGKPITSTAGAMGLMQVMPVTYAELRRRYGFGADPYDPGDNIGAGTAYLSELYRRYGYPALFVAYHAGPKRYEDFLLRRDPLPAATLAYVDAISPGLSGTFGMPPRAPRNPPQPPKDDLFVARSMSAMVERGPVGFASNASGLFVPLSKLAP
jgi:Transglycosylase SLT domain